MATTKGQMLATIRAAGEDPAEVVCFYRPYSEDERYSYERTTPLVRCSVDELPEREFDEGYGGVEGEDVVGFGPRYVYVKGCYDGAEWIEAVPRHPESVGSRLPQIGGG